MKMTRTSTPLRCVPSHYLPPKARADFLHSQAPPLPSHLRKISANRFLQGDCFLALHPAPGLDTKTHLHYVHVRADAAVKGKKPPPKPASRGVVLAAIFLPIAMAGTAVAVGRILLARIQKEALEEVEEWEKKFNSSRLLPDGLTDEERKLAEERRAGIESGNVPSVRNRPKREE